MSTHLAARLATAVLLLCAPFAGGCGSEAPAGPRSGTATDDTIEEPLTEAAKPFENALRVSNAVLDLLEAGDIKTVYAQYLDPRLQQKATEEQFAMPMQVTLKKFGAIKGYKPMQWGFARAKSGGMSVLYSTKIVEHERGTLRYHFSFEDDGKYAKLIGLAVQERKGVAPPGPP